MLISEYLEALTETEKEELARELLQGSDEPEAETVTRTMERTTVQTVEKTAVKLPELSAMSDYIERELRCRDTGFVLY